MVRKSTRSALKTAEKAKPETPRKTRGTRASARRRKNSTSEESEDEYKNQESNQTPDRSEKDSSENGSPDRDSKKPFKKRIRGRNRESPVVKLVDDDDNQEVKEGKRGKGKSKSKNKSNNDTDNVETENDTIQVTNESPSSNKEEQQTDEIHSDQNSSENITTGENIKGDTEIGPSDQQSSNEPKKIGEINEPKNNIKDQEVCEKESVPNLEKLENMISKEEKTEAVEIKIDADEQKENQQDKQDTTNDNINIDKHESDSKEQIDSVENKTEESNKDTVIEKKEEPKKKITLKRISEVKQSASEECNSQDHQEVSEEMPKDTWSSSYESNTTKKELEDKTLRKKISLKRRTTEDKKEQKNDANSDVTLERSCSLQEQLPEKQRNQSETESVSSTEIKRRHSTSFEKFKESEEKSLRVKKPTKSVKLVRNLISEPLEGAPSNQSEKKSKWGKSEVLNDIKSLKLDELKEICPSIEFLPESELDLEIVIKEPRGSEKERHKSFNEMEAEEMEKIEAELNAEPEDFEEKENIIAMNRKISIVDDTASKLKPPPSPPKNPVSEVLYITNLVRPFTVKQLKELLERTGKIREEGFWTDRIKSKCYVHYETAEEAEATRNALHGVHWPIGNGKQLIIEFGTVEDLETAKYPPVIVRKEKTPELEIKKPEKEATEERNGDRTAGRDREWGGKKEANSTRSPRSRSRDRQRKHSRRSYTPEDYHSKRRKREEPVPQKAMDDLFLKTKATPSIYWQPLSPEEIALKQQQRQARLEENKRRMEEMRLSGRREQARERDRRDRNFRRR